MTLTMTLTLQILVILVIPRQGTTQLLRRMYQIEARNEKQIRYLSRDAAYMQKQQEIYRQYCVLYIKVNKIREEALRSVVIFAIR